MQEIQEYILESSELMGLKEVNEIERSEVSFLLTSFIHYVWKNDGSKVPAESLRQIARNLLVVNAIKTGTFSRILLGKKSLDASLKHGTKERIEL